MGDSLRCFMCDKTPNFTTEKTLWRTAHARLMPY
jgi:hypothetical protein